MINEAMRQARVRAGLSLEEAAERLCCDPSTLWRLETGKLRVTADWAARAARAYRDVSILAAWLAECPVIHALAAVA